MMTKLLSPCLQSEFTRKIIYAIQDHPVGKFSERKNMGRIKLIGAGVVLTLSGCYNVIPSDPTTETYRCYKWEDYADARVWGRNPRGKGIIQASRSLKGNKESALGNVTIGGITFQAEFRLVGVMKVWYYLNQGTPTYFAILPSSHSISGTTGPDGERNVMATRLHCVSD